MIQILNSIVGWGIWAFALFVIRVNPSLRNKYEFIKYRVSQTCITEKAISNKLIQSVIAIEDKRFYAHKGIDIYSIIRALYKNIFTNRLEGASTITQQLVRNIIEDREIKLKRKIKEILLSVLVSRRYSKNQIVISYLNTYSFGNSFGVNALCTKKKYDVSDLSTIQACEIAAMLKYPSFNKYSYIKYLKRVRIAEMNSKI